jgi:hypothetical protein
MVFWQTNKDLKGEQKSSSFSPSFLRVAEKVGCF